MILLTLLLALPPTGDEAIALAKKALADFDVAGPLRLQALSGPYENGDRSPWHLKVSGRSRAYSIAVTAEGRIRYIEEERTNHTNSFQKPSSDDAAKAARWLKRFGPRLPTRLMDPERFGGSTYYYQGLVEGYPVVYPATAVGYRFTLRDGALQNFGADETPPSVGPKTPKLSEADALLAVARLFPAFHPPHDGFTFSYSLYLRGCYAPWSQGPSAASMRVQKTAAWSPASTSGSLS